jgi:hypothetical protein
MLTFDRNFPLQTSMKGSGPGRATNAFGDSRGRFYLGALKACFHKRTNENVQAAQQRRRLGNAKRIGSPQAILVA